MLFFKVIQKKSPRILEHLQHVKEKNLAKKLDESKKTEFLHELRLAQNDLETARNNYNFAQDTNLLDYYIYEIKAAETRVNYYLKLAKKEKFRNEPTVMTGTLATSRGDSFL